ncbi:OmpA family protein [bacterium]|nr:OmpA family protein [bacterium]
MKAGLIALSAVLIAVLTGAGFFYTQQVLPMQNEYDNLTVKAQDMKQEIRTLETELNNKVAELTQTKQEKKQEIDKVKSTKDSLIAEMQQEIQDNKIQITQLADKLNVSIVDKILFASGEASISDEGLAVLKRVGDILNKSSDHIVRVEGHTDNVPTGRTKDRFPTNWELSTARATTVVRFLQENVGMEAARLEAVGLGEFHPVADNETKEGRAKNRRIEISLLPVKE